MAAVAERASATGRAVALIRGSRVARPSLWDVLDAMSDGNAPVLSARSVRVVAGLAEHRATACGLLESLLRRHARYRHVTLLIDGAEHLDPACREVLGSLVNALRDANITWLLSCEDPASLIGLVDHGSRFVQRQPPARLTTDPPRDRLPGSGPGRAGAGTGPQRPSSGWDALTPCEQKVALLIADGHTNRSAAAVLVVSPNTVGTHVRSIYAKLDVNSRVQMTRAVLHHRDMEHPAGDTRDHPPLRTPTWAGPEMRLLVCLPRRPMGAVEVGPRPPQRPATRHVAEPARAHAEPPWTGTSAVQRYRGKGLWR
jgi:DNA-binding CsgD family transcriptional regulator